MDQGKAAADIFNKYASDYQTKFMNVDLYADSLNFFCDAIKKQNASVLELACGPGNITKYILDKRPDLKIFGTDLAPNMIGLAKQNNPSAEFAVMDCREIKNLNKRFGAVMCGFCLPYLSKEEALQLISDSAELLDREGVIYISTMEDDHSKSGFKKGSKGDEIFMNYHEESYLRSALEKNNFEIVFTGRKNSTSNNEAVVDLILIAKK
jgi:ubiquinone/menaquinone biosynthesis C-methylase UbiE